MPVLIPIILFALPVLEIFVCIQVGGWIGVLPTIGLIVLGVIGGSRLIRAQGMTRLTQMQQTLRQGELPVDSVIDGALLILAGLLLIIPGFITDALAVLLMIPFTRRLAGIAVLGAVIRRFGGQAAHHASTSTILEGEYREIHPSKKDPEDPRLPP